MFARFGHPKFGTFQFNENRNDADSVRAKDFTQVSLSSKTMVAASPTTVTFSESSSGDRPFIEVAS